jgi:hypothetical protein
LAIEIQPEGNSSKVKAQQLVKELRKRLYVLEQEKEPVLNIWEQIGTHIIPRYESLDFDEMPYEQYGASVYDGTGLSAARIQAVGLQGYTVSPSMEWFHLGFPIPEVEDIPANKAYFEDYARSLYGAYRRSNFYSAMTQLFMQGGTIGTTVLYLEEDLNEQRLVFRVLHPREYFLAENRYRVVDTVFRKFDLSAREALKKFPEDRLSDELKMRVKERPDDKFRFVHAVYPNNDRIYGKLDAGNKRFASVYFEERTAGEDALPLIKSGYDENPYMAWRWSLLDDGPYGASPAWDALYDVIGLNAMAKDMLIASNKMANPPMVVPKELRGVASFEPAGSTYVKDMQRVPQQLLQRIDMSASYERERDIREIVKQHFNVDFFLMLATRDQQMTATEIRERQTERSVMLGPAIGNLQSEVLSPNIDRTSRILADNDELPPPPPSLEQYLDIDIRIDFMSPLAQAQRRIMETQGLQVFMEKMVPLTELWPEWRDRVDIDEFTKAVAMGESVKSKVLRSDDEVQEIRDSRAEQEAQQAQLEQEAVQAQTMKDMSLNVEPNSPLAAMQEGEGEAAVGAG